MRAVAEAELAPPAATAGADADAGLSGGYAGPLAFRQGKPLRPGGR